MMFRSFGRVATQRVATTTMASTCAVSNSVRFQGLFGAYSNPSVTKTDTTGPMSTADTPATVNSGTRSEMERPPLTDRADQTTPQEEVFKTQTVTENKSENPSSDEAKTVLPSETERVEAVPAQGGYVVQPATGAVAEEETARSPVDEPVKVRTPAKKKSAPKKAASKAKKTAKKAKSNVKKAANKVKKTAKKVKAKAKKAVTGKGKAKKTAVKKTGKK